MVKISVLLATYNTKQEHLRECIESILHQTYTDFELIIADDGSTTDIESIIHSYTDIRIKFIKNRENKGISAIRNQLIDLATGEYIAVSDHDDISLPHRFQKQVAFLDAHPDISVVSAFYEHMLGSQYVRKVPEFPTYLDMVDFCCLIHPVAMWRRADFEKFNLRYDESYTAAQDYELWSRVIRYCNTSNIQEVLLRYRNHPGNTSSIQARVMGLEDERIKREMLKFLTHDLEIQEKLKIFLLDRQIDLIQKIFSVRNEGRFKVVRLLGFKLKFLKKEHQ